MTSVLSSGLVAWLGLSTVAGATPRGARPQSTYGFEAVGPSSGCNIGGPTGQVKHVIEMIFDNVHFNRDNPNVLSDIEQIPSLEHFIEDDGTLLSNNHTPLIAHTANDTITNYTGLYGDRTGEGNANDYYVYKAGSTGREQSSFTYWTAPGTDSHPAMDYSAVDPPTDPNDATPPAPWVPFTRAGCDVGAVSTSNMELENLTPDLANVFGANSPEVAQLNADSSEYQDQETNDYIGLAVHCAANDPFCTTAEDTKYGEGIPTYDAVADNLPSEPGGYGGTSPVPPATGTAAGDPSNPGTSGSGYLAVLGHKYLQPVLADAANATSGQAAADGCANVVSGASYRVVNGDCYEVTDAAGNLVDLDGQEIDGEYSDAPGPGFPGFDGITAAQTLAYMADMQETGVPVTYGYISDVHESKDFDASACSQPSREVGNGVGPADPCYYDTTAAWNQGFADFFQRLSDDGINASDTIFIFGADEGDHFNGPDVGRAQTPSCTGTPLTLSYTCTYSTGDIGEVDASIHSLLRPETADTTPFTDEPQGDEVYVTGTPSAATVRQLERDFGKVTVYDQYDQATENAVKWMDSTGEELLHFSNADPARVPTFTVWPIPDVYFSDGTSDACKSGTTAATAATGCVTINSEYDWDHGYYAPEINNTWLGLVGPGIANLGVDGYGPGQGPSSAGNANSGKTTDIQLGNPGTWTDQSDARPTLMYLTGLKDDYTEDGRVITPVLTSAALDADPAITNANFEPLAECYKQLNSSVGEFGTDVITASTSAMESGGTTGATGATGATGSTGASSDSTYSAFEAELQTLGAEHHSLAATIKQELWNAEFEGTPLPDAALLTGQCNTVLASADGLAAIPFS